MATRSVANPVKLAQALPPRLLTFLARYPPVSILPTGTDPATAKTGYQEDTPNPFLPLKHPVTGRWHNPKYSLRRQAELVKMAREHGVEELLPYTPKGTDEKISKRVEFGLRVKGTGVGQQVKGHKHERQMIAKYVLCRLCRVVGSRDARNEFLTGSRQDGKEETSDAQHAEANQRMEEGKLLRNSRPTTLVANMSGIPGRKDEVDQVAEIVEPLRDREHQTQCKICITNLHQKVNNGNLQSWRHQ